MRWRWLDVIDEIVVDERASARVRFPTGSPFFEDHFPGFPVVPGVLLVEAMAQLGGKLIGYSVRLRRGDWPFPILSMANGVKFRRFVRPDECVHLECRLTALRDESAVIDARSIVGGRVVAQAEEMFVFNAVRLESEEEAVRLEQLERAELRRLWPGYPGD